MESEAKKESPERQLIGVDVGPYHIVEKLGEGGMGVVYRAVDRALDRDVALKILFEVDEPANVKRFTQEAKALARLTHPNTIQIFWTGEFSGEHVYPCFAMEYISDGVSVYDLLRHKGVLPLEDSVDIVLQAARGLAAARRAGIVHRDIKPNNLLIDVDGTVKISDFGLAKLVEDKDGGLTQSGIVMGTPYYMSPEQGQGEPIDHRSDLYSLGATFYHMITGFTPYEAQNPVSLIIKHVKEPIPDIRTHNPQIPDAIRRIVETCLAKSPDDRYQEYEELIEDLEAWQNGKAPANLPAARRRPIPPWLPFAGGLGVAALALAFFKFTPFPGMGAVSPVASQPVTPVARASVSATVSATPVADASPLAAEPGELERARQSLASSDASLRAGAAVTFGKLADKAAVPDLLKLAGDPDAHVRARAVWALGRMKDPRAAAADIDALRDEDPGVVLAALDAVDGSNDVKMVEPLERLESSKDLAIAHHAQRIREKVFQKDPDAAFGGKPGTTWCALFRDAQEKIDGAKTRYADADRSVRYYKQKYGFSPGLPSSPDVETQHVFKTVYAAASRSATESQTALKSAEGELARLASEANAANVPAEWRCR